MIIPPMPNTCHPDIEHWKEDLVAWLGEASEGAFMPARSYATLVAPNLWDFRDPEPETRWQNNVVTFTARRKVTAPAPWTERPYRYVWRIAEDGLGRWVAGNAQQLFEEWRP